MDGRWTVDGWLMDDGQSMDGRWMVDGWSMDVR